MIFFDEYNKFLRENNTSNEQAVCGFIENFLSVASISSFDFELDSNIGFAVEINNHYGHTKLTQLLALTRGNFAKFNFPPPKGWFENLNTIKNTIAKAIAESNATVAKNIVKRNSTRRILIYLPILPSNINNNIANVIFSYFAEWQKSFGDDVEVKFLITNELLDGSLDDVSIASLIESYKPFQARYGYDEKDLIVLQNKHTDLEVICKIRDTWSPTHVFVLNFELCASFIYVLGSSAKTIFAQSNIRNIPAYTFDVYLSCGEPELLTPQLKSKYEWKTFQFGYPKFGFQHELPSIEGNSLNMVFVSNRVEAELTDEFLSNLKCFFDECDSSLTIFGVKNKSTIENRIESSLGKNHLAKVHLNGYVNDIGDHLSRYDVYVNPYRFGGGVSMALSIFAGTPVLLSSWSDASNYIKGEGQCFGYAEQFALLKMVYRNPEKIQTLLREQSDYLHNNHLPINTCKQIVEISE